HRAILTALASRDAGHAAALMQAHVNGGLQRAHEACEPSRPPGAAHAPEASTSAPASDD
ncbi:MAG TPA: phosphonate utilization associated transcriptional regulator, partial [Paraburkholderia sp.]|nr:phosphonate utilization associated transcriptional regulator [Paraburkholderia sp.]